MSKIKDGIGDKLGNAVQYASTFLIGILIGLIKGWKLTLVILSVSPLLFLSSVLFTKVILIYCLTIKKVSKIKLNEKIIIFNERKFFFMMKLIIYYCKLQNIHLKSLLAFLRQMNLNRMQKLVQLRKR